MSASIDPPHPDTELVFRCATESDYPSVLSLMQLEYGDEIVAQRDYFTWQYVNNPIGRAVIGCCETDNGAIVGVLPTIPMPLTWDGKPVKASLILNVLTHPDYRRRGLFVKCGETAFRALKEDGTTLVYGFPNKIIHAGYIHKLGCRDMGSAGLLIRVHDVDAVVAAKLPRAGHKLFTWPAKLMMGALQRQPKTMRPVREIESFEDLRLHAFTPEHGPGRKLTPEWLTWRYRDVPGRDHDAAVVGTNDKPHGLIVLRTEQRFGVKIACVTEFLTSPGADRSVAVSLAAYADSFAREHECAATLCLAASGSRTANLLRSCGFLRVPKRFEPHPYPIIWKELYGPALDIAADRFDPVFGSYDY